LRRESQELLWQLPQCDARNAANAVLEVKHVAASIDADRRLHTIASLEAIAAAMIIRLMLQRNTNRAKLPLLAPFCLWVRVPQPAKTLGKLHGKQPSSCFNLFLAVSRWAIDVVAETLGAGAIRQNCGGNPDFRGSRVFRPRSKTPVCVCMALSALLYL
jgi:hypothetical protein